MKPRRIGNRSLVTIVALTLAAGAMGVTYAAQWGEGMGVVQMTPANTKLTWAVSNDNGVQEGNGGYTLRDPIDPGDDVMDPLQPQTAGQPTKRYDQNVASTTATLTGPLDISVTLSNAYPSYQPTVFFGLQNSGTISTKVVGIEVDEDVSTPGVLDALTASIGGIYPGLVLEAGAEKNGALHINVERTAKQNRQYTIGIRIKITVVTIAGWVQPAPYQEGDDAAPIPTTTMVNIIGLSSPTSLKVDNSGMAQETAQLTSLDGRASIIIAKETKLINAQGKPLDSLSASRVTSSPPAPPRAIVVSAYSLGPEGAAFNPPITLTLSYDPLELPQGVEETELYIGYWNGTQWLKLESIVDIIMKTVSAKVSHFSQFALLYNLPPPPPPTFPAAFQFGKLWIRPSQIEPGQEVTIDVEVANTGGIEGGYAAELKINGRTEETKMVTVAPGASKLVRFAVTRDTPGTYWVSLGGISGEFIVATPVLPKPPGAPEPTSPEPPAIPTPDWTPFGSTIGAVLAVFLLVYLLWRRRRAVSFATGSTLKSTSVQHRAHIRPEDDWDARG